MLNLKICHFILIIYTLCLLLTWFSILCSNNLFSHLIKTFFKFCYLSGINLYFPIIKCLDHLKYPLQVINFVKLFVQLQPLWISVDLFINIVDFPPLNSRVPVLLQVLLINQLKGMLQHLPHAFLDSHSLLFSPLFNLHHFKLVIFKFIPHLLLAVTIAILFVNCFVFLIV
jgi:hypothetical protein